MANITIPQQQGDRTGTALGLAGMIPGPVGAVAQGVGIARNLAQSSQPRPQAIAPPQGRSTAIQRRLGPQSVPIQERIQQLQVAEALIPQLPREVQEEVAPPIFSAIAQTAQEFKSQQGVA